MLTKLTRNLDAIAITIFAFIIGMSAGTLLTRHRLNTDLWTGAPNVVITTTKPPIDYNYKTITPTKGIYEVECFKTIIEGVCDCEIMWCEK